MSKVHIVTDSNSQLPDALCQELDIHVVPLPFVWDGATYVEGVDMGYREFYARLRQSETVPTTSAPTPGSFKDIFDTLTFDGKPILVLHVGSEFSSTFRTAQLAKEMLPQSTIELFDSHCNAGGFGFQVLAVARAARQGADLDELLQVARVARKSTGVVFAVDDIEYLHRGGRIGFGQRLLASSLDIVPIMEIHQGPIHLTARIRTMKRALDRMVRIAGERLGEDRPRRVSVGHSDNEEGAYVLEKMVEEALEPDELLMIELSPILGIHAGPDGFGLGYCSGI